jgi:hypothetical protein
MATSVRVSRHGYTSLDLPRPWRSALVFAVLCAVALSLDAAPDLPWTAGVVAGGLFAAAGAARTFQEYRELVGVRRTADRLIVHAPTSRDATELVRWRSAELTIRASRDRLSREVGRTVHMLDPGLLPSTSPLRRAAARGALDLFEQVESRLADERPVAARGVLLAQVLLRDAASPLYSEETEHQLRSSLRRILGALEP